MRWNRRKNMYVYVLDKNGNPLMPTKRCGKVRHLLRENRARVVKKTPFTIQLTYDSTEFVQKIDLGIDTGSKRVGISATTEKDVLLELDVELRTDIVDLLSTRRQYRRARRSRKLRYRKPRFLNRVKSKKKGWLAPSIRHKINSHHKLVNLVFNLLPIDKITVETASFDIQKLKKTEIEGKEYQEGEQLGFWNVREYVLFRDKHQCQGKKGCKNEILNVHHIESRKTGGNAPNNLITLCKKCHVLYHTGKLKLRKKRGASFRDATFMGIMRWAFYNELKEKYPSAKMTYGYLTKNTRIRNNLPKEHIIDARCISGNPLAKSSGIVFIGRFIRKQNRSLHKANPSKGGKRRVNTISQVKGFNRFDKIRYKGTEGYIHGLRSSGYFDIRKYNGEKIHASAKFSKLDKIESKNTLLLWKKIRNSSTS
jgi:hypothetical protein